MNAITKIIVAAAVVVASASSAIAAPATKVVQLETVVVTAKRVVANNEVRHLPTVTIIASRSDVQLAQAASKTRKV